MEHRKFERWIFELFCSIWMISLAKQIPKMKRFRAEIVQIQQNPTIIFTWKISHHRGYGSGFERFCSI
jgi:hypothetical protein